MVKEIYAHLPPDYGFEKPKEGKVYEADKYVYGITREGKKVEVREADVPRKIHQVYLEGWYSRDELIQIAAMKEMSNG
jgi:ribosomal protein L24